MPTNRRTIERRRKVPKFTDEVLDLFERGMQLVVEGYDDIDAPDDEKHDEFRQISKRLDWTLLGRAPHETSIFEDFADLEPPEYMKARESEAYPDFNGYRSWRLLQQRLLAALEARRRRTPAANLRRPKPGCVDQLHRGERQRAREVGLMG
jgi:hypothetical protein